MSNIEVVTIFFEETASSPGLILASLVERNINPTTKLAWFVPDGLAMSDEYHLVGCLLLNERSFWGSPQILEIGQINFSQVFVHSIPYQELDGWGWHLNELWDVILVRTFIKIYAWMSHTFSVCNKLRNIVSNFCWIILTKWFTVSWLIIFEEWYLGPRIIIVKILGRIRLASELVTAFVTHIGLMSRFSIFDAIL